METREAVSTSFVLVHASWTPTKGLEVLESFRPLHVIVYRRDDEFDSEYYYLFSFEDVHQELMGRAAANNIKDALNLHEPRSSPTVEASADAASAPPGAVVIDEGRVLGFIETPIGQTRGLPPTEETGLRRGTGATEGAAEAAEVNRTVVAKFPEKVAQNDIASLRVLLSAIAQPGEGVPFATEVGEQIDIMVEARRGFTIEGPESGTFTVTKEEEGLPLLFKLRATDLGPGLVVVFAFHRGLPLGKISLSPIVAEPAHAARGEQAFTRTAETALAPLAIHVPDLDMLIQEWPVGTEHQYSIMLTASDSALGLHLSKFGPLRLRMDPVRYFGDFFNEIEQLPLRTASDKQVAKMKLEARGTGLFNTLFPPDLRKLLWTLKDRISSIWVQSEEPWIPWELCKLESETHEPGQFLCEAYSITRWVPGRATSPTLHLNNVGVVVPSDSRLPLAQAERDFLLSMAGNGRQVTPITANWAGVYSALQSGRYDGLHFTGHGAAMDANSDRSRMILEEGNEFMPADISGEAAKLGRAHPLVFLNACQIGRGGMSLTGVGGWATRFLEAGAGAFIGAYWSVFDQAAEKFTEALYSLLLGGTPIGEAVKSARASIKPLGDPTWLAYTVFADPLSTVEP